jgi:thiosulfate reductase cytochrome b subunit
MANPTVNEAPMAPPETTPHAVQRFYRHRLPVRVMHWVNVISITVLLMSGLNIFNAHPALYWGKDSNFAAPWLAIGAQDSPAGPIGVTRVAGREWQTTGVLGLSQVDGALKSRAFPSWATVPGPQWLSMARHWHFFFAWVFVINGIAYVLYTLASRHLTRDLLPTRAELRGIGASIKNHLLFRHPSGEAAKRYNVLQSLTYLIVIFVLLPLVVLAGLAMSPRLDAVYAGWVDLLGGRQSARSLHFIAAAGLLLFTLIHLFEVIVAGVWNEIRSMLTGWYTVPADKARKEQR